MRNIVIYLLIAISLLLVAIDYVQQETINKDLEDMAAVKKVLNQHTAAITKLRKFAKNQYSLDSLFVEYMKADSQAHPEHQDAPHSQTQHADPNCRWSGL